MFIETRIRLNVGGHRYETTLETLRKHPQTLLGKLFPVDQEVPMTDDNGEYFFDRDGEPFGIILNFYRNDGKLFWPRTWDRFSPETLGRFFMLVCRNVLETFFCFALSLLKKKKKNILDSFPKPPNWLISRYRSRLP